MRNKVKKIIEEYAAHPGDYDIDKVVAEIIETAWNLIPKQVFYENGDDLRLVDTGTLTKE